MATRWARVARGWATASFALFVAALSHTLGGGAGPGALAIVLSLAFAGVLCIGLSGRAASLWRVSVSVLASQLIFHGLFSLGAPGGALATGPDAAVAHAHSGALALAVVGPGSISPAHPAHGAAMWFVHGVAAIVTIAALRYGDAAVRALLRTARVVIRRLLETAAAPCPPAPRRAPTTARVFTPRDLGVLLSGMRHRGPPMVVRVA